MIYVLAELSLSDRFVVIAETREAAERALRKAWKVHRRQTGAYLKWDDVAGDVNYCEIAPGQVLRDGSPI